jgi:MFS family permease
MPPAAPDPSLAERAHAGQPGFAERIGAHPAVLALSLARLGDAIGNSILFVIIPLYVAKLPAPWFPVPETVRVGILISLYGLVNSVFQPVGGFLTDRFNRRKLFIQLGLLLMAGGTLTFAVASRFTHLLLLRALQGVGVALTIPASMAIMTASTVKHSRGGSMGVYSSMRMVGFASGPLLGGFLYDRFGFDAAFYAGTAFVLLAMLLVQLWVKDTPANVPMEEGRRVPFFDRKLLTPGILGLGAATFVMAAAFSMMTTLEKQFNERLEETAFAFGVAFSSLMVSRLIFQIPLGRLSDRIGRKPLIVWGLVVLALATAPLGLVASTAQLTALRIVQGAASAGIAAPAFALAADLARVGGEGRQMSVITMGFGLGLALGPLTAGVFAMVFFNLPFLIAGCAAIVGALIVWRYVPESVQRPKVPQG